MTDTGSEDTRTRYYAHAGKVYAEDIRPENELGTARSANGAELERFDRALQEARAQRAELERVAKLAGPLRVELVQPARSHWLAMEAGSRADAEPFSKEELHPIARVHFVPRVGTVLVDVSADRYVASYHDDATGSSSHRFTEWRIYAKRVRADAAEAPELYTSPEVSGVGPMTRPAINAVVTEAVRGWLESEEYERSRQRAAAAAIARQIKDAAGRGAYAFDSVRNELERAAPAITTADQLTLRKVLGDLVGALTTLETLGKE